MTLLVVPDKITAGHRERRAVVYVRQSSPHQVQHNRESQANQYALVQRAVELGWVPERVRVFDADLGTSGQDSSRADFRELVAEVTLGQVGLVLTYEVSRVARSNADWYTLLDLAAVTGALIADADGVYDPRTYNDRMLLGLRGMLSEAELHLLKLRLDAGKMRKIERGAYRLPLPTGLVRLPDGSVAKEADQQVQRMIQLIFERFAALGSCQKVLRSLRGDELLLPRRQTHGLEAGQLLWKKPSESAVYEILRNPAYAGAFVYGRMGPHPERRPGHSARRVRRRQEEWLVVHHDAYPAYITWEEFVPNQARLNDNASRYARRARGAVRDGEALLVGMVVCGRCGRQMQVVYKPQIRYICSRLKSAYAERPCVNLGGASVERAVVQAFFAALAPAELDVLDEVLAEQRADRERVARQCADRVTRATYEVRLARRRYDAVDPDNRLVAAELERRWELALRAEVEAKDAAARFAQETPAATLDATLRAQLRDLGHQLPALWDSGRLRPSQKKELLRSLIRRIVLTQPAPGSVEVKIVWVSGAYSELVVYPPVRAASQTSGYARLVERVLELAAQGFADPDIAQKVTAEGFRSAHTTDRVPVSLVFEIRHAHGQSSLVNRFRTQEKQDGGWTIWGLARMLGVDRNWLYRRIIRGELPAERDLVHGYYRIADDPALLEDLRTQVPTGHRRGKQMPDQERE
jgi:DNA invertase Pin-like site-specific DNA recombinase